MNRQALRGDAALRLRLAPPPIVSEPPPVVVPKRREYVEEEPELPFEPETPHDQAPVHSDKTEHVAVLPPPRCAEVPVVRKRVAPASEASATVADFTALVAPPERVAPEVDPISIWSHPVPTYTYLAGAAGSGKTFLTKAWAEKEKGLLLCATTGIAAINLGGETINSVLGYFDTQSLQESYINGSLTARLGKLWRVGVRRLILDEVSMLAGDQLTYLARAIEEVNQRGYVLSKWTDDDDYPPPSMGLTLVGDFCQLSPVKATYAFESEEWSRFTNNVITLTEIRRQADPEFIQMLRAARAGHGGAVGEYFQSRGAIFQETDDNFEGATIVAKNDSVDRYNQLRMDRLPGQVVTFPSTRWGKLRSEWGQLEKPKHTWGIPEVLTLKIGALVMILANRRDELRRLLYVNGDLGTIEEVEDGTAFVRLQRTGEVVEVEPITRVVKVPADAPRREQLRKEGHGDRVEGRWEITGEIIYLPARVAYASTVHKSQGLTLDRVQINIRDHFFKSPGMMYVALSRARTAGGLRLVGSPQVIVDRCSTDPRLRDWL